MTMFFVIVLAILTAMMLWNYPQEIYRIANRIVGLGLILGVIYMILK
jgi:hypothetical protein